VAGVGSVLLVLCIHCRSRHDLSSVVGECHGSVPMYLGIHSDLGLTETPQLGRCLCFCYSGYARL